MNVFKINGDYITITQLLKVEGFINSGGEIASFLLSNEVLVNKNPITEKRKKLYPLDIVKINATTYHLK